MPVYRYVKGKNVKWMFKCYVFGRQILRRGFLSKAEAKKAEMSFMLSYKPTKKAIRFQDLLKAYVNHYSSEVKFSSLYSFKCRVKNYLEKVPNKEVSKITYADLHSWFDNLEVSYGTKQKLIRDIGKIFEFADAYFQIHNAEYKRLSLGKDYSIISPDKITQRYILSINDFSRLYKAIGDDYYWQGFFLTAFVCGLRISEILGIQVKSIDFNSRALIINQQATIKCLTSEKSRLTSPKTKNSNRFYLLPDNVLSLLQKIISKKHLKDQNFVFYGIKKTQPIGESTVNRKLKELQKKAELPKFRFHTFRKSEASLLNDKGLSGETIKDYLGHDSFNTTKEYYLGDNSEKKEEIRGLLSKVVSQVCFNG